MKPFKSLTLNLAAAAATLALAAPWTGAMAQQKFVTIGTGGVTGVYYAAGGAICRLMNKDRAKHGIRCSVESTGGSVFNINTIKAGELDFGVTQSDWQYHAKGRAPRCSRRTARTRICARCFRCTPSPSPCWRARKSTPRSFEALKGKRFNVGNPGSGTRASMEELLSAWAGTWASFSLASELKADEHGAGAVRQQDRRLLLRRGPSQRQHPGPDHHLRRQAGAADRPGGGQAGRQRALLRQGQHSRRPVRRPPNPTPTYGVLATFVTSAKVPDATVYELVKAVFDNFEEFKKLHPAFGALDPKEMVKNGNSAPMHPGAVKFYKEKGWL
jgi:TRAP-type uncharacterized transport system substrate-binding protein